jgi:hypothetical protein
VDDEFTHEITGLNSFIFDKVIRRFNFVLLVYLLWSILAVMRKFNLFIFICCTFLIFCSDFPTKVFFLNLFTAFTTRLSTLEIFIILPSFFQNIDQNFIVVDNDKFKENFILACFLACFLVCFLVCFLAFHFLNI